MSASMPITDPEHGPSGRTHVVAAAVFDARGRVLLALRPEHVHQGGRWEFPGGKREAGESARAALERELHEELGIRVIDARPLIRVPWNYPGQPVLLDVWRVDAFQGEAHGREGQAVEWVALGELHRRDFPAANRAIVHALQLPDRYLITPEPGADRDAFLARLEQRLADGIRLVQLRAKSLDALAYRVLAEQVLSRCRAIGARLLLNAPPALARELGADGVQLSSQALATARVRELPTDMLLGASCHTPQELARALDCGADFALLSPVQPTASHPETPALGWERFARWVEQQPLPVYALGGMACSDLGRAQAHGAQGIAAIRALWDAA